jgi:predicted metal-dependent phosphoesterase TrpH
MRADLHIHTTASDGRWPPDRLVAEVKARAIDLFAVADHDTVGNVRSAEALAREEGLAFLRSVEVSASFDGRSFHILAYGVDPEDVTLEALLRDNRTEMRRSNEHVLHHLVAAGYKIDLDDYAIYEHDRSRGGWKTLNFLIDQGFCTGVDDYFGRLTADIPAWRSNFSHPIKVIDIIRGAGGVPILAHPGVSPGPGVTDAALEPFLDWGIAGLECYSWAHNEATTRYCLDWCARHDLLVTGGSDSHGGFVGRKLGVPVVDTIDLRLGELEERIIR